MIIESDVFQEFLTEAREHLENIEVVLLDLEQKKSKADPEQVNSVFRSIHTIKGNAGFFKLMTIEKLAHSMENVLSRMRSGEMGIEGDVIDELLKAADSLKIMLDKVETSNEYDISSHIEKLAAWLETDTAKVEAASIKLIDINGADLDFEVSESLLKLIPPHHDYLYFLKYDVAEILKQKKISPVALIDNLLKLGEIIRALVKSPYCDLRQGLPENKFYYSVLYSTVLDPDLIAEAIHLEPEKIFRIDLESLRVDKSREDILSPELVDKFREEAEEYLENAENNVLDLEKNPADKEPLETIYREIHNLKGNAGFFGLGDIEKQCISIEEALEPLRKSAKKINAHAINDLLAKLDFLKSALNISGTSALEEEPLSCGLEHRALGQILLDMGKITEEELDAALNLQHEQDDFIEDQEIDGEELSLDEKQNLKQIKDENKLMQDKYGVVKGEHRDIRVNIGKIDSLFDLIGELVTVQTMIEGFQQTQKMESYQALKSLDYARKITKSLQETAMSIRTIPIEGLFTKMKRLVRDLSRKMNKKVNLEISGEDTEIDRKVIEDIADPLIHIIRNAVDHGLENSEERKKQGKNEQGVIKLSAKHESNEIWITIEDDGRGLSRERILKKAREASLIGSEAEHLSDHDVWQFIFKAGFSTSKKVSEISGRGVGMDVVKKNIEKLHGSVIVSSEEGRGSVFILKIPLTLAIVEGVVIEVAGTHYAIPTIDTNRFYQPRPEDITETGQGKKVININDKLLPLCPLYEFFNEAKDKCNLEKCIVIVCRNSQGKTLALLVDKIIGYQQIVIKPLPIYLRGKKGLSGCSIGSNGQINLILDVNQISDEFLD